MGWMMMTNAGAWLLEYPQILAALVTFALGITLQLGLRVFAAKPRLRWGITSDTIFLVPMVPKAPAQLPDGAVAAPADEGATMPPAPAEAPPPQTGVQALPPHEVYRSRTLWLVNSGTAIAEEVEVAFNWQPQHMEWYPHIPTTVTRQPDGRHILTISRLNPKEGVTFSLLSLNQEHPNLLHVRCKGFGGKPLAFRSQQIFPLWVNVLVATLMFLGAYTVVNWALAIFLWVVP